jgi:C4-dicarboxylate-specific signal transduction histidine kinase
MPSIRLRKECSGTPPLMSSGSRVHADAGALQLRTSDLRATLHSFRAAARHRAGQGRGRQTFQRREFSDQPVHRRGQGEGQPADSSASFVIGRMRRMIERNTRSLEARLTHVGRFHLLGEMASGIAHEINQPLSAITTYAEAAKRLMQRDPPDMAALARTCDRVAEQARRASEVITNLRSFLRKHDAHGTGGHEFADQRRDEAHRGGCSCGRYCRDRQSWARMFPG